jgi:hypothetical protein
MINDNYKKLLRKLDIFIKKYYKNQIIKGLIYSVAALLVFYLTVTLLEYFAWMNSGARTIIFYTYLIISIFILFRLIFLPLFKLFKIGKIISHKQAAGIIGKHFTNVQDQLLNTLQLKELSSVSKENIDLINASIDQKTLRLQPVPFDHAIDLKGNRKYLKYVFPPLIIFLSFLLVAPGVITEPTNRIIRHTEYFEREAPFCFILKNEDLTAIQQEDCSIEVIIEGERSPEHVYVVTESGPIRMRKQRVANFEHTFRNVQNSIRFSFEADGVKSETFILNVLPKPMVLSFETEINYPNYTGRKDEKLENTGDLVVPEGTYVEWRFFTRDADALNLIFDDSVYLLKPEKRNVFGLRKRFLRSAVYSVSAENEFVKNADSLAFSINVTPDVYPIITIEEFIDSLNMVRLYFRGLIKDDYGFSKLRFSYKHIKNLESEEEIEFTNEVIPVLNNSNQQQFFHFLDLLTLNLKPGDEVKYYFEVWDNDAVNGSKSTRTRQMIFKSPTDEEIAEKVDASNRKVKDDMESAMEDLTELQREIEEMQRMMLDKESLNWQDRHKLENMFERRKSIEERVEEMLKTNEEKLKEQTRFDEVDESIMQKHEELQKLMEELLSDEMKALMEEIQKLLDELDKDKISEMLQDMKMSNQDLEDQLDRTLELFKQLEFEQKLQETIDKLNELAQKQDDLSEETKNADGSESSEELKEKQDQLNEEFDNIRKDLEDLRQKNQELENPNQMQDTTGEEENIENLMQESSQQLQNNQKPGAQQKQKDASQQMQELSDQLQEMMESMMMEQMGEDLQAMRQILNNLIRLSFDQEELIIVFGNMSTNDPKYTEIIQEQFRIKDNMAMVADSLQALSKRQMAIQSFVTKELNTIDHNFEESIESMNARNTKNASQRQQLAMTSINNLALLLFEAFDQMQQQMMQMQAEGQSSCPNPGKPGGSKQMKSMQQMQQQLNEQLQQLKDGKKPGESGRQNQQMSEQLARMAAQQAELRKRMEAFRDQLREETGTTDGDVSKIIEDMEKTEKDIVNRQITQETLNRQKEILTRMLKSEKAEMQREQEERREGTEARDYERSNPEEILEYFKLKNKEVELLKTLPPNLTPFYRNKVSEYFFRVE